MFNPQNLEQAKQQVVGDCNEATAEQRWEEETPIFRDIILKALPENAKTVLDYGCGAGRLAKDILEANRDIKIIGVDTSKEMLQEAEKHVLSNRFITKTPGELNDKVDFAYAVYVFQHIPALELRDAIKQVANASDKMLFVGSVTRMAVKGEGFINDEVSVLDELLKHYTKYRWGLPFKYIADNWVIRNMFLEKGTLHYAVLFEK